MKKAKLGATVSIALMILGALGGPAWGQASDDARLWIERMGELFDKAPLRLSYNLSTAIIRNDRPVDVETRASLVVADPDVTRARLTVSTTEFENGSAVRRSEMLIVADGDVVWIEFNDPTTESTHVLRAPLDALATPAESGPMGGTVSLRGPVDQIQRVAMMHDWRVVGRTDGRVTLEAPGPQNPGSAAGGTSADAATEIEIVRLVLDERTGHPLTMLMTGEDQTASLQITDLEFLDRDSLDPHAFSYTPPEQVAVTDLGTTRP